MDAAHGTVVILRNPNEVSNIVKVAFSEAINERYGGDIPIEFRDTDGPTTMFMFDKSGQIDQRGLVNGSLLYVIGEIYPTKIRGIDLAAG